MNIDDMFQTAKVHGVDDKIQNILSSEWDKESVVELLSDQDSVSDLIDHVSSGAYDKVQEQILENARVDIDGTYTARPKIEQYRIAVRQLQAKHAANAIQNSNTGSKVNRSAIDAEKAKIKQEREKERYQEKAAIEKKKKAAARKRAASVSTQKKVIKKKSSKQDFDPLKLSDEEFTKYVDGFLN
jgi:hypothetical protein